MKDLQKRALKSSLKATGVSLIALALIGCAGPEQKAANEAKAEVFRSCVAQAGISGNFTTSVVRNDAGNLSAMVEASDAVPQAKADAANACIREKGL
ncbi:MAG: hypothetical protein ABJO67_00560 [Pseudoruegeria sp.]